MNQRQTLAAVKDQLELLMIACVVSNPNGIITIQRRRDVIRYAREAQRLIEDSLSGPRVSRQRRIAAEVALTGYEQELDL